MILENLEKVPWNPKIIIPLEIFKKMAAQRIFCAGKSEMVIVNFLACNSVLRLHTYVRVALWVVSNFKST